MVTYFKCKRIYSGRTIKFNYKLKYVIKKKKKFIPVKDIQLKYSRYEKALILNYSTLFPKDSILLN